MGSSSKGYRFDISGNTVTAVYEVKNGREKLERIDANETYTVSGTDVIKTEQERSGTETTTYSDPDGDGVYMKTSKTKTKTKTDRDDDDDRDDDNDDDNGSGNSQFNEKGVKFDLDANGDVATVYKVERNNVKVERVDNNESWSVDGANATKTETKAGEVEQSFYRDSNGDGVYQEIMELEVLTSSNSRDYESYQFTVSGGNVTGMLKVSGDSVRTERLDSDESLDMVMAGGDTYIVKTESGSRELEFDLYRDDDNDGLWTKVAEGESRDAFVQNGQVDVVGIVNAGLLQPADALVG